MPPSMGEPITEEAMFSKHQSNLLLVPRLLPGDALPARLCLAHFGDGRQSLPGSAFPGRSLGTRKRENIHETPTMKIHEYQAKELLAAAGAAVPRGIVAASPAEVLAAFDKLGAPVVLKAQIHAGGRGKGTFKGSGKDFGGVKFVTNRANVAEVAEVMFKYPLATKQTGADGQRVSKVLVVGRRAEHRPRSLRGHGARPGHRPAGADGLRRGRRRDRGGRGRAHPEKILKTPVDPDAGLQPFQARRMAFELGFTGEQIGQGRERS